MVARANEGLGGVLQSNAAQWRAYIAGLMRQQGIDPTRNIYAAQTLQRAPEAQWLGQAMNVTDTGIQDFGQQWLNARLNGGGTYGGVDLSRQGTTSYLQGALANNDPNSLQYQMFNTGDPEADYANLGSAMGIMQSGSSPMARAAQQRTLGNWYERALGQMQQAGPGTPTNLLNYYFNRQDAGPGTPQGAAPLGAVPPGTAGQPAAAAQAANAATATAANAAYNPATAATAANAAAGTAANLATPADNAAWRGGVGTTVPNPATPGATLGAPGTTPIARPGQPGYATPTPQPVGYGSGAPAAGAPAAGGAVTSWAQLLDKYRGDQRNWGTRGFRPTEQAFNIGGIAYDPSKDQVSGWNNMSGQGRVTNRGNMMGQFLYYLNLLRTQRDGAGNAALGITRATTDQQLAEIAKQRMSKNAIGSTGFA